MRVPSCYGLCHKFSSKCLECHPLGQWVSPPVDPELTLVLGDKGPVEGGSLTACPSELSFLLALPFPSWPLRCEQLFSSVNHFPKCFLPRSQLTYTQLANQNRLLLCVISVEFCVPAVKNNYSVNCLKNPCCQRKQLKLSVFK